jgi:hypothetical protein
MLVPPYGSEPPPIQRRGASQTWTAQQAAHEAQEPVAMAGEMAHGGTPLCDSTTPASSSAAPGSTSTSSQAPTETKRPIPAQFDYEAGEAGQQTAGSAAAGGQTSPQPSSGPSEGQSQQPQSQQPQSQQPQSQQPQSQQPQSQQPQSQQPQSQQPQGQQPQSQQPQGQQPQGQQPQQAVANAAQPGTAMPVPDPERASTSGNPPAPEGTVPAAAAWTDELAAPACDMPVSSNLALNLERLRSVFTGCSDIVFREFLLFGRTEALLVYVDGLLDTVELEQQVLRPLLYPRQVSEASDQGVAGASARSDRAEPSRTGSQRARDEGQAQTPAAPPALTPIAAASPAIGQVLASMLPVAAHQAIDTMDQAMHLVLRWQAVLFVAGETRATALSVSKWPQRAVEEPDTEAVIRGPREGFTENVRTGTALIRRRIHTPDLKMESMQIGRYTETQVVLCYIQGLVDPAVVAEMRRRLGRIDIDGILESGYIEELIEDMPFSPFPQIQNTEKPDVVTALLLEGRVALLIDGTPFALVAPINLWGAMAAPEDYYERFIIATLIRWLRYAFVLMALTLPALYVAISTFHQEALPFALLLSVAAARENTPFPAVIEALIMETIFEALREAGVRLPKTIGSAISIVGALVIGQAAVQAGLVSAPMVIIVAVTGIASFTIPRYNFAIGIRMLRFPIIILAGMFGIVGILFGVILVLLHLCSLRSLGVPYTQPLAPAGSGIGDALVRRPWWAMTQRPSHNVKGNTWRQGRWTAPAQRLPAVKRRAGG